MNAMKKTVISILCFMMLALTSCSDAEPGLSHDLFGIVSGSVTDMNGKALEHISITVKIGDSSDTQTFYTSSEGKFRFDLPMYGNGDQINFIIIIRDIDGEENGGYFQDREDEIILFGEDYKEFPIMIEIPPYRLSPATALESSPRS